MKLKQLFTDDRAVSPVIGVILMVAITVILAAVIGSFVLNLGGNLGDNAPQASFDFDYKQFDSGDDAVEITHATGDSIDSARLDVVASDNTGLAEDTGWSGQIGAGDTANYTTNSTSWGGETIRVTWTSEDGENSATIAQSTAPQ